MLVALDGSGDFGSVQEAVNAASRDHSSHRVLIRIKPGIYKEKIKILAPSISLIGEDPQRTILTFDDCARKLLPNGETMNTFNSYSIYIGGGGFYSGESDL
ncbi:MAG TPA: pectinesterase family protein [Bacillota bacterium]|nr:pectinesterase family protein [Bacillota bacterium]